MLPNLQQSADARETESIATYVRWQGWRDEWAVRQRLIKQKRRADIFDLVTIILCLGIMAYFLSVFIHGA